MRVRKINWLPHYEDKLLEKHHVLAEEVEEVLFDPPLPHIRLIEKGFREGENMYAAYGQTTEGRYLVVFYILKADLSALIISARDMDRKERKSYGRRKNK